VRSGYESLSQKLRVTNPAPAAARRFTSKRSAFLVAAGIFLSRIAGLIRDRVFAHYFGNSDAADAFKAAFRIPNALANLSERAFFPPPSSPSMQACSRATRKRSRDGPPERSQVCWLSAFRFLSYWVC